MFSSQSDCKVAPFRQRESWMDAGRDDGSQDPRGPHPAELPRAVMSHHSSLHPRFTSSVGML